MYVPWMAIPMCAYLAVAYNIEYNSVSSKKTLSMVCKIKAKWVLAVSSLTHSVIFLLFATHENKQNNKKKAKKQKK